MALPRSKKLLQTRKHRIRKKISGTAERPRLSIYRSLQHFYAQLINDVTGQTLLSVSTLQKDVQSIVKGVKPLEAAHKLGAIVAEQCKAKNITAVVFDRNGRLYHGRVAAIATGARKAGLQF